MMKKILPLMIIIYLISIFLMPTVDAKSKKQDKNKNPIQVIADAPKINMKPDKPKTWQPELKVGLFKTSAPVKIIPDTQSIIVNPVDKKIIKNLSKDTEITIKLSNGKIIIDGKTLNNNEIEIRPKNETDLKNMKTNINGKIYFGGVKLKVIKNQISVINIVTVEEYLRAVVPKEMSSSWHEEALKAQAVAARTFSLKNRKRHENEGYDLCSNTHCQLYTGVEAANERTDEAIIKTFGEILQYKNKLIDALFHSDSGGMTENAVDVWGTDFPYLRVATEIEMKTNPWTVNIKLEDFAKKLTANKKSVGKVHFIKVTGLEIGKITSDRSSSGRVKELSIIGEAGEIKLTGLQMRNIFNLNSTLFDIGIIGDEVKISGYGWGHGVGLSQYGANNFAEHGYSYTEILSHYYKNTERKRLY